MATFRYTARTQEGDPQSGTVDAVSEDAAASILHQHGLVITKLVQIGTEGVQEKLVQPVRFFERVTKKDLVYFSRQIAILFETKVPVLEALRAIAEQIRNPALARALFAVIADVNGGAPLSEALGKHPKIFNDFYISMVRSGETSGKLREVFMYLAEYLEREYAALAKTRSALMYPALILVVLGVVGVIVITMVLPQINSLLQEVQVELPLPTRIILFVGNLVAAWWWVFLLVFVGGVAAFVYYMHTPTGKAWVDRLILKIPIAGRIVRAVFTVRIANNLGTLVSSGIPIIRALEVTEEVVGNEVFRGIIQETGKAVERGERIHGVWEAYPQYIPVTVTQMVAVGERTGQLDSVLEHVATFYQKEVDRATDNLTSLIEPVIIVLIGVAVAIFVAGVLLPLYNLTSAF